MSLTFDLRDFKRVARQIDAYADQIPFALAQALNDGAEAARKEIAEQTWPRHVHVRNARFMRAALSTKGTRATKRNLRVEVYDRLGRGSLLIHERGGQKLPRGSAIAVPSKTNLQPRRTGSGVPKGLRPRNLPPESTFKTVGKFGTPILVQRTGRYVRATKTAKAVDNRGLKVLYGLAPSVPIKAQVPFHRDFERVMRREVLRAFRPRLRAAMATRRKREVSWTNASAL